MPAVIRLIDTISRALGFIASGLLALAVLVVVQMVFVRYVLQGSTVWQTEFVTYSLIATTFLGSPYVLLLRGHVNVDLIPNLMTPGPKRVVGLLAGLMSLTFCALLAWSGWTYFHEAWTGNWTTETVWRLPLWIPLLPLPLGIGWLCVQYLAEIYKLAVPHAGWARGKAPAP